MKRLVIVGASGHGKVVADIANKCGYDKIVFLDDDSSKEECNGYPVVGNFKDINRFCDFDILVAIGDADIRQKVQIDIISNGLNIPSLIHPNAIVASDVQIGKGTVIMAGAIINSGSKIGNGCIINTGSTIDHDNIISDYVHVSVGSHIAGSVFIGKKTWIGAGAIVINNIKICENCIIGAGAVVVNNIEKKGTYIGVPAKRMKGNGII